MIKLQKYTQEKSWKLDESKIKKLIKIENSLTNEHLSFLKYTEDPKSNKEIQEDCLKLKKHTDNFKRYIEPLLENGLLTRTIPEVPKSRLQKYFTTDEGKITLYISTIK